MKRAFLALSLLITGCSEWRLRTEYDSGYADGLSDGIEMGRRIVVNREDPATIATELMAGNSNLSREAKTMILGAVQAKP